MTATDEEGPLRLAALLFRRVGDSLLATPALRAIKQSRRDSYLCVIVEPQVARVFQGNSAIDEIVVVQAPASVRHLTSALRRVQPDMCLDFLSDPRSAIACRCSGAQRRIGFAYRGRRWLYTHHVGLQDPRHPVYSAVHKLGLAAAVGCTSRDFTTDFAVTQADRDVADAVWVQRGWSSATKVCAFFVHSRREYKRWPLESFAVVIEQLQHEGRIEPLVLDTPGDQATTRALRDLTALSAKHVVTLSDLGHLAAVLERCQVLVGNDGGPKHQAVAVGTPTVTIFGRESPVYWTPPDDPHHIALADLRHSVSGHGERERPQVAPAEVVTAIRALFESSR